jgi:hypothetical protein
LRFSGRMAGKGHQEGRHDRVCMTHRWSQRDSNCWSPSKEMLASATIRSASAPLVGRVKATSSSGESGELPCYAAGSMSYREPTLFADHAPRRTMREAKTAGGSRAGGRGLAAEILGQLGCGALHRVSVGLGVVMAAAVDETVLRIWIGN